MKHKRNWYRDPKHIRKPQRHKWTREETERVLELRDAGISAQAIALELGGPKKGFTVTKVYNITRIQKRMLSGTCTRCSKPLTDEEKVKTRHDQKLFKCFSCRKTEISRKRKERLHYLKKGICPTCKIRKVEKGHTTCQKCRSYTFRNRLLKGLCGTCGKRAISVYSDCQCHTCMKKQRDYARVFRGIEKKTLEYTRRLRREKRYSKKRVTTYTKRLRTTYANN